MPSSLVPGYAWVLLVVGALGVFAAGISGPAGLMEYLESGRTAGVAP